MPKITKKESIQTSFNFKIDKEILKQLTEVAKKEDRTIASIIRLAINEYLKKYIDKWKIVSYYRYRDFYTQDINKVIKQALILNISGLFL